MIKVSDFIARRLRELGAEHVFMVTGGGAMHLNDSFARVVPYRVTYNHHEQACAIAAEGLFRACGKIGIVNVTTGPGGLNALTGLMGQWTDSIPAIYVSGQVKHETTLGCCRELGLRQLGDQEVDIIPVVAPLAKYAVSLCDPKEARFEIEKAWHLATSGRQGPVWIDVPMNVQGAMVEEAELRGFSPPPTAVTMPDAREAAQGLLDARRPVIVAGHGLRLSGTAAGVISLAERLSIPVLSTFNGYDLISSDHPCFCGRIGTIGTRGGNFTLQNADFVLLLGTRNNIRQVSYNWENFAKRAFTIAVDIDEAELRKPTFRPGKGILADLREFIPALEVALDSVVATSEHKNWLAWAKARHERYPVARAEQYAEVGPLNPYPFFKEFTEALPRDAVVVAGNGTACVALFQAGVVKQGQRVFWNSGCASMGYDLPAAIGAAVGTGAEVYCVAGDGSLQMNLQELATVAQNRLPVKIIYLDNGGYASIRQTQLNFFGGLYGCGTTNGLGFPDLEKLAAAYGIAYRRSASVASLAEEARGVVIEQGPLIWHIDLKKDYSFEPKLSSRKLPDGKMVSPSLEDMYPFLPEAELRTNIHPEAN